MLVERKPKVSGFADFWKAQAVCWLLALESQLARVVLDPWSSSPAFSERLVQAAEGRPL